MDRQTFQALSIALVGRDGLIWSEGFGWADGNKTSPATPDTVYRVGSLAKPLTASAILQLRDRGVIGSLATPVNEYVPPFSINSRHSRSTEAITLKNVLTHHSGLPSDIMKGMWSEMPVSELVEILHTEYAPYPADYIFSYSNVGYSLLGNVVEKVSGDDFPAYMHDQIFIPLGMKNSAYDPGEIDQAKLAQGNREEGPCESMPVRDRAALGLYSSVNDLSQYVHLFLNDSDRENTVLSASSRNEQIQIHNSDNALDIDVRVGFGWFIEHLGNGSGIRVARHGGAMPGYTSEMIVVPEYGLAVIALTNRGSTGVQLKQLATRVLENALELKFPDVALSGRGGGRTEEEGDILETDCIDEFTGDFATTLGLLELDGTKGAVRACIDNSISHISALSDGWYKISEDPLLSPHLVTRQLSHFKLKQRVVNGHFVMVASDGGSDVVLGERLPELSLDDQWLGRMGDYEVINPDPDFPFIIESFGTLSGNLCLTYRMPGLSDKHFRIPLYPVSDKEAVTAAIGRQRSEAIQFRQIDGDEYLAFSGYLAKLR